MKNAHKYLAVLAATALSASCGPQAPGDAEPGAITETSRMEIPGAHSPDDLDPLTAQRWIDNVHLGRALDTSGKVPVAEEADRFATGEDVLLSMEVTDAPAGSIIQVAVFNSETQQNTWSDEKAVPAGQSHLNFSLSGDDLSPGRYRAEIIIGDETVAKRRFEVVPKVAGLLTAAPVRRSRNSSRHLRRLTVPAGEEVRALWAR